MYVVCVNFIHNISGRTYSLKPTPNDRFFEKLFMAILFTPRVFAFISMSQRRARFRERSEKSVKQPMGFNAQLNLTGRYRTSLMDTTVELPTKHGPIRHRTGRCNRVIVDISRLCG